MPTPTLDEIGASLKTFGDKAVAGLDTVTKGLDALRVDLTDRLTKAEKRIDDISTQTRERPNGVNRDRVEVAEPTAKNVSLAKGLALLQDGADVFTGKGFENAQTELAMFRKGIMERAGTETWGQAETLVQSIGKVKALSLSSTTSAGGLIPSTLMAEIISLNRSQFVLPMLGVRQMDGLQGSPVEWNRQTAGATYRATGENPAADFTADDLTYTQIQLTPHEFVAVIESSNRLLMMNPGLIESEIRNDLVLGYERKKQAQVIAGTGIGGNCLGILARAVGTGQGNINDGGTLGTSLPALYPLLVQMKALIMADDNPSTGLKWLLHPNDLNDIQKAGIAVTTSAPATGQMISPIFSAGDPTKPLTDALIGYPVATTTDMTEGSAILADWTQVGVGTWSGVELASSNVAGSYFKRNQTGWRAIFNMDVGIFKPSALCVGTGLNV